MSDLSPAIIAAAKKIQAKQEKDLYKRRERIAVRYPFADPTTLEYDRVAKKYVVVVTCPKCSEEHSRYTQDLKQTQGICPNCKKGADAEKRQTKNALMKKAMQAIAEGKIKPEDE